MSRSLKKGPFIDHNLDKKVMQMNQSGKKSVIKSWARASMISPDFVGHTIAIHKGEAEILSSFDYVDEVLSHKS